METKTNVEGTVQEPVAETQSTPTLEDLQAQLTQQADLINQLSSSKERILNESKEYKTKFTSLRDQVDTSERTKLEESENWKELLDREKNEKHELTQQFKDLRHKTVRANINFAVSKQASDAWDLDDVVQALNIEALNIDEDLSVKGVEDALREVRERKPHLFKSDKPAGMMTSRPGGAPKNKDISEMTDSERKELLNNLF